MSNRDRAAEVLDAHYYDAGWSKEHQGFRCVCGWLGENHVHHVTDVLVAAGLIHVGQGFCTKAANCRLADGHAAGCERT